MAGRRATVELTNIQMKIKIRKAENSDFLWLMEYDTHISENTLKSKIDNKEIYIFENCGKKIGWLRYNLFWDSIPFLNMIYFLEDYRRIGFGTELIKFWEKEMKLEGYENVLTSTQSNEEAQHFYRKTGYKEIGGFKYLNDPFEIIFQKILI